MAEHALPVPPDVLEELARYRSPLLPLASLSREEVIAEVKKAWEAVQEPVLRRLADAILSILLKCLSTRDEESYLTFEEDERGPISIVAPRMEVPDSFRAAFPVEAIEGFEEFLTYFGGLRDWRIGHSGDFVDPRAPGTVSSGDFWGNVSGWEGALVLYTGGSGDCVLLRQDGAIGAWCHEIGWTDKVEPACWKLDYSFLALMEHFSEYIQLPRDSKERKESPFYY